MSRDLDIDIEEQVDSNFRESIKGVTSKILLDKMKFPSPLYTFKLRWGLENRQVNTARFIMEGAGLLAKYWLCTGLDTLNNIMEYNIEDEHYNELIKVSDRKDVLCLYGLPLFYSLEHNLGDCLLLVSDINQRVRTICFMVDGVKEKSQYEKEKEEYLKSMKKVEQKKKPKKVSINQDGDYIDDDIPF